MENYNPTCIYTGKKDNLVMKAHRNEKGDMVGWIFVHESMKDADAFDIDWKFTGKKEKNSIPMEQPYGGFVRSKIDNL